MTLAGAVQQMKTQLWQKLGIVFIKYASSNKTEIPTSRVEEIIHDALGEQTPQEIDYVVKNMFRLDSDSSGTVSFDEFGNFLFKRHCGEMSLQKMHMQNQMSHGSERKMTDEEFYQLINKAYKFLQVKVHHEVTSHIFNEVDTDRDGLISYVEYFEVINRYICKSAKEKVSKPIQINGKERNSRLRSWMWIQLRKLYESYIHGRYLSASDKELRGLICSIVGDLSQSEMNSLLSQLFLTLMRFIEFEPFACVFLNLIAELRLSRYSRYHNLTQKTLSKDEFSTLFKNTYHFLALGRIRSSFLDLLYKIIDQNHDGVVSYDEYLDWVKRFIAVQKYFGDEFYFKQDDLDLDSGEDWLFDPERKPVENRTIAQKIKFVFKDHMLAYAVRERMYSLLIEFDKNRDELFDQTEIQNALRKVLKENENELRYVTGNVFRYDMDGDRNVTYEQFTNFCVEQHFGEMAIQRLHKRQFYSKGSERMMNLEEFGKTLNFCLGFINIEATNEQVHTLFNQIDLDHDGWVSYEVYFFFLKYYFGSLSLAAQQPRVKMQHKPGTLQKDIAIISNMVNLSAIQKLVKLINSQLQEICARYDVNRNMVYEPEQIQAILTEVFLLTPTQIDYIMYNYFRFDIRNHNSATYTQFISIVLQIFFIQILFNRVMRKDNSEGRSSDKSELGSIHKSESLNNHRISIREFMDFMDQNLFFIRLKPSPSDLLEVFQTLDTDKDGFISFEQYIAFIRHFLGRGLEIVDQSIKTQPLKPQPVTEGITPEELQFVDQIWGQLKKYFDKYDTTHKSYLNESQLKSFAVEVLHETSQRQLDYIFWNLFRVDGNYNHQVDFQEFAPFVLKHAAQSSLQRFHREQVKGNSSVNEDQLYFVLNGAYSFLLSMPKNKLAISNIFRRINKNGSIPYGLFLSWVNEAIAKRYR